MAKKFLKFKEVQGSYQIWNNKEEFLGDIYKEKKGWVFYPMDTDYENRECTWFTVECLEQITKFMRSLEE